MASTVQIKNMRLCLQDDTIHHHYITYANSLVLYIALSLFRSTSVIALRKRARVYETCGCGGTLLVIDAFTLNCDTLFGERELNPIITRFLI